MAILSPVADGVAVVVCNSCRFTAEAREDAHGVHGGAQLIAALRAANACDLRCDGIAIQEMACLFACSDHCTVHIRAPGKIGYVLGRFSPDLDAARAILDYAMHYAVSAEGEVPFGDWPEGVKGHSIVRVPPAGFVIE